MSGAHHAIRESGDILGIAIVATPQLHLGELQTVGQLEVLVDGSEATNRGHGVGGIVGVRVGQLDGFHGSAHGHRAAESDQRHVKVLALGIVLRMDDELGDVEGLTISGAQIVGSHNGLHLARILAPSAVGGRHDHGLRDEGSATVMAAVQLQGHLMGKLAHGGKLASYDPRLLGRQALAENRIRGQEQD